MAFLVVEQTTNFESSIVVILIQIIVIRYMSLYINVDIKLIYCVKGTHSDDKY